MCVYVFVYILVCVYMWEGKRDLIILNQYDELEQ